MVSLGSIIWTSFEPMLKIYFTLAVGYYFGKKNILDIDTFRNVTYIDTCVLFPSLMFSSIVTGLSYKDIKAIGIICFNSVLFMAMAAIIGAVLTVAAVPVPKKWRYGAFFSLLFSNVSNIFIGYLQSISNNPNIFSAAAINKGIAYCMVGFFVGEFTIYNLSGYKIIGFDFQPHEVLPPAVPDSQSVRLDRMSLHTDSSASIDSQEEPQPYQAQDAVADNNANVRAIELRRLPSQSVNDVVQHIRAGQSTEGTSGPRKTRFLGLRQQLDGIQFESDLYAKKNKVHFLYVMLLSFLRPRNIGFLVSFTVAMVPWLKALFVATPLAYVKSAPDEQPPLNILLDYCSYMGAALVPLSLFLHGSTLSRLDFTNYNDSVRFLMIIKNFAKMFASRKGAVLKLIQVAVIKTCIMPILGIAWISSIYKLWSSENILFFILCLSWAMPSLTSQIYITAFFTTPADQQNILYNNVDGENEYFQLHCLACCLLLQYIILFFSLPFISSFVLKHMLQY